MIHDRSQRAVQDPVLIDLAPGREAGMEFCRDLFGLEYHDVGWKQAVQGPLPGSRLKPRRRYEIRRLSFCVNPGIGSACTDQVHFALCDDTDLVFDDSLNGRGIGLSLPAMIGGSIILQDKLDIWH